MADKPEEYTLRDLYAAIRTIPFQQQVSRVEELLVARGINNRLHWITAQIGRRAHEEDPLLEEELKLWGNIARELDGKIAKRRLRRIVGDCAWQAHYRAVPGKDSAEFIEAMHRRGEASLAFLRRVFRQDKERLALIEAINVTVREGGSLDAGNEETMPGDPRHDMRESLQQSRDPEFDWAPRSPSPKGRDHGKHKGRR